MIGDSYNHVRYVYNHCAVHIAHIQTRARVHAHTHENKLANTQFKHSAIIYNNGYDLIRTCSIAMAKPKKVQAKCLK